MSSDNSFTVEPKMTKVTQGVDAYSEFRLIYDHVKDGRPGEV